MNPEKRDVWPVHTDKFGLFARFVKEHRVGGAAVARGPSAPYAVRGLGMPKQTVPTAATAQAAMNRNIPRGAP